ncbi:MAG: hypothetical protein APG12_00126 [Candidatus Methanofastidiosum methylothiophilum]|uniref:YdhG-like domain-containing protein n=1 Tax=Candidatus Methanofastidiosum methylothiophilum TaxID=1705564 RepID=A0A150J2M2_9EURY|nr:MAG: hypothetical protein APG10_00832 [Candidatus Methanofastidiosum methylthiophilus]KYC47195.1 MAG: hypothetical protein APG11_01351 [Candidatus Methanofastidiosum methylthiophilus]KYC51462.1 MAG: hypothetical protein APG12_00126 [Candidatus Methanofastidiosum methylthiophilus]
MKKEESKSRLKKGMAKDIDGYIKLFPKEVQEKLKKIREIIKEVAPCAEEKISYGMPTFVLKGKNLVHFAAYRTHIGFYPTPSGIEKFKSEISVYEWSKGTVKFPLDEPVPFDLIREIVAFRAIENLEVEKSRDNSETLNDVNSKKNFNKKRQ